MRSSVSEATEAEKAMYPTSSSFSMTLLRAPKVLSTDVSQTAITRPLCKLLTRWPTFLIFLRCSFIKFVWFWKSFQIRKKLKHQKRNGIFYHMWKYLNISGIAQSLDSTFQFDMEIRYISAHMKCISKLSWDLKSWWHNVAFTGLSLQVNFMWFSKFLSH